MSGKDVSCPLGFGGLIQETGLKDNLASVPTMQRLGYQFWFGHYPFMTTPDGTDIPLYVKSNGYLALRMHPMNKTEFKEIFQITNQTATIYGLTMKTNNPTTADIGYVSNDVNLWHGRCCHIPTRVLKYMQTKDLVYGLPNAFGSWSTKQCLSCGMGKSCCQSIGPTNYKNSDKMEHERNKLLEVMPGTYYPLEQVHIDTCEMDSMDIYGNKYFVVIAVG